MSVTFSAARPDGPEVNVHTGNAAALLDLLGLAQEPYGQAPAEDFLGRALLALGLVDVATNDAHGHPAVPQGRWVHGGHPPGHLTGRLQELADLARWAHTHHVPVTWG